MDSSEPTKTTTHSRPSSVLPMSMTFTRGDFVGERVVILQHVRVIGQVLGRADIIAENVLGRWNDGRFRQMIHQRADEFGPGGPFLDQAGEFVVHLLGIRKRSKSEEAKQASHVEVP